MEKEINTLKKIKEEDLVDFFNSHYFSNKINQQVKDKKEAILYMLKNSNINEIDLSIIFERIEKGEAIEQIIKEFKKEKIISLPKCENDLKKIVFDVEHAISQKSLSEAYTLSKYLLNKISETMIRQKETMKVVINDGYGGFFLSQEAMEMLAELKGKNTNEINIYDSNFKRHDKDLVKVVETLGDKASGICAELIIVEIPKDIDYRISDYDGWEKVVY